MALTAAPPAHVVVTLPDPDMDNPLYFLEADELLVTRSPFIRPLATSADHCWRVAACRIAAVSHDPQLHLPR